MTIPFKDWLKESSKTIDFSSWNHEDKVELYFERMDVEMFL